MAACRLIPKPHLSLGRSNLELDFISVSFFPLQTEYSIKCWSDIFIDFGNISEINEKMLKTYLKSFLLYLSGFFVSLVRYSFDIELLSTK